MDRGRNATLVVVDEHGHLLGATDPLRIEMPWWQETGPIVDALPGTVVLRLLEAEADEGEPMGGHVTYLVQRVEPEAIDAVTLHPWDGELGPHPLRHPWAMPGGPAADLAWVSSVCEVTGPPRQHRSWNLSAITSAPTTAGIVWLKCVPEMFVHEGAVLELLVDQPIPRLIAADQHRLLLADLPGEDGHGPTESEQVEMIDSLVAIQRGAVDRVDALIQRGVPDLRSGRLTNELAALVTRLAPQSKPLQQLIDGLPARLQAVDSCGIPDTLVHGDPHGGNCRRGSSPPIWFDWGDSFVGNPLLDLAATHRMSPAAVDHWLTQWGPGLSRQSAAAGLGPTETRGRTPHGVGVPTVPRQHRTGRPHLSPR